MDRGFWDRCQWPLVGLSPMDGITDTVYRSMQKEVGAPDVVFTEFTSAEGITHNAVRLFQDFLYTESQRPVVAQIFGKDPQSFRVAALVVCALGFDGIDINMGCPAKSVRQHGSGAALIRTPELAQELIQATKQGVADWVQGMNPQDCPELSPRILEVIAQRQPINTQQRTPLPVSVKTRIGYDQPVTLDWIKTLLEEEPVVISVHGRLLSQLYTGVADWEQIALAAELCHQTSTKILGNGDIDSAQTALARLAESTVDGILVGRSTFGNPWLLRHIVDSVHAGTVQDEDQYQPTLDERLALTLRHAELFESTYPGSDFLPMRKHLAWYVKGFPFASDLRVQLVRANSAAEVRAILETVVQ